MGFKCLENLYLFHHNFLEISSIFQAMSGNFKRQCLWQPCCLHFNSLPTFNTPFPRQLNKFWSKYILLCFFFFKPSQYAHNVVTTSIYNVHNVRMTSYGRWNDVVCVLGLSTSRVFHCFDLFHWLILSVLYKGALVAVSTLLRVKRTKKIPKFHVLVGAFRYHNGSCWGQKKPNFHVLKRSISRNTFTLLEVFDLINWQTKGQLLFSLFLFNIMRVCRFYRLTIRVKWGRACEEWSDKIHDDCWPHEVLPTSLPVSI